MGQVAYIFADKCITSVVIPMITDKEYPATHSMDTSWYGVDLDGNIAMIEFNDNGPVPYEIEQTCIADLIFGHDERSYGRGFFRFELTDEQIDGLLEPPEQPSAKTYWGTVVIEIDPSREDEFMSEIRGSKDFTIDFCISRARGLYEVSTHGSVEYTKKRGIIKADTTLRRLLDLNLIKSVREQLYIDCLMPEQGFGKFPYYVYYQDYNPYIPIERRHVPSSPVMINQVPPAFRDRLLRLPIRFRETSEFNIAEWHLSKSSCVDGIEVVNGCEYKLLPLNDGTEAYICSSLLEYEHFVEHCSLRSADCKHCLQRCYVAVGLEFTNRPTVIFIFNPAERDYALRFVTDVIVQRAVSIPLMSFIPGTNWDQVTGAKDERYVRLANNLFVDNSFEFEFYINRFKPRVIICYDNTVDAINRRYGIKDNVVTICDKDYPIYLKSQIEAHRDEIERLATLPYRGEVVPHIITREEMEHIKTMRNDQDREVID